MGPASGVVMSPWIALPLAAVAMLVVAWHAVTLESSEQPPSRRRIRTANGWVMLLAIPLIASGASLISPSTKPRAFVLVWTAAAALVVLAILLAIADAANTWRLARHSGHELTESARRLAREALDAKERAARRDRADRAQSDHGDE